jgi:hypothetical protein
MSDTGRARDTKRLFSGVLILNARILGLTLGILSALAIFVATNWLLIKGGERVGPHLRLLGEYFPGYRITFGGSLIGAAYAFGVGAILGGSIGWIYNRIAGWRNGGARDADRPRP